MKNLFKVNVQYTILVRADNKEEAEREAEYVVRHEDEEPEYTEAFEINDISEVPLSWRNARPWGETDPYDRTVKQILGAT